MKGTLIHDMMDHPPPMDTSHIRRKWLDVRYAERSPAQKLDIYLPDTGDGPFPVIATFHGGGWMFGDKGDAKNLHFLAGLSRGYAVVCVNYRLSDEAQFPCQIHDCRAAVRYLKSHAAAYQLDGDRIGAWGASAGAHLVALLATSAGDNSLEDLELSPADTQISCEVQAVVGWYGPTESFLTMDEELKRSGRGIPDHSQADSPESRLLGRKISDVPELVRAASPLTYINKQVPPFLIQHGLLDQVVPVEQSIHFAAALEKIAGKNKVTLEILDNAGHGDPLFETPQNVKRVLDFLDLHLKP